MHPAFAHAFWTELEKIGMSAMGGMRALIGGAPRAATVKSLSLAKPKGLNTNRSTTALLGGFKNKRNPLHIGAGTNNSAGKVMAGPKVPNPLKTLLTT